LDIPVPTCLLFIFSELCVFYLTLSTLSRFKAKKMQRTWQVITTYTLWRDKAKGEIPTSQTRSFVIRKPFSSYCQIAVCFIMLNYASFLRTSTIQTSLLTSQKNGQFCRLECIPHVGPPIHATMHFDVLFGWSNSD